MDINALRRTETNRARRSLAACLALEATPFALHIDARGQTHDGASHPRLSPWERGIRHGV